jgi:hypothetical protein
VTYVRPGQTIFTSMKTHGGWYRSPFSLRRTLVSLGLSERAPSLRQSGLGPGAWAGIATGIAVAVGAAAMLIRRRPGDTAA